jgi:hypothetical protein
MTVQLRRIDLPDWANAYDREGKPKVATEFSSALYDRIQTRRGELLDAVHLALVAHVDACVLDDPRPEFFPKLSVITGDYYLSRRESYCYSADRNLFHIIFHARFLGQDDQLLTPGEPDDYLGIDVSVEVDSKTEAFVGNGFSLQVILSDRWIERARGDL